MSKNKPAVLDYNGVEQFSETLRRRTGHPQLLKVTQGKFYRDMSTSVRLHAALYNTETNIILQPVNILQGAFRSCNNHYLLLHVDRKVQRRPMIVLFMILAVVCVIVWK